MYYSLFTSRANVECPIRTLDKTTTYARMSSSAPVNSKLYVTIIDIATPVWIIT